MIAFNPSSAAKLIFAFSFLSISTFHPTNSLDNGLARTPPMGWLAWERFGCQVDCVENPNECINSALFETMADKLVEDGYSQLGYKYVNIDDCWSEMERDSANKLVANRTRFPYGIEGLSTLLHNSGLKLGIYGDCGIKTCARYPAQLKTDTNLTNNYFEIDANLLAQWQVDSFKFDGCFIDPLKAESICPLMAKALNSTERPILLVCEWPFYMMYTQVEPDFKLAGESCNVWRYYDDIEDSWLSILNTIDYTVKHQSTIVKYHGPGHWFDPDQLVIGNFGLSADQARAQMAIWSVWAAPLYMSNDLRDIKPEAAKILKNKHLIEANQDELGVFGLMTKQSEDGSLQAFVKPVLPVRNGCPSFVVVYLNRKTLGNQVKMSFELRDLLLGAPIYEAAKHQRELDQPQRLSATIKPGKCLKRITKAMRVNSESDSDSEFEQDKVEYRVYDLLNERQLMQQLALNAKLELAVNPSGVSAVRLEENEEQDEQDRSQ